MRRRSFRWHPYAVDPGVDYSREPTTLIVFELQEDAGGTLLSICESGFDHIPLARPAKAFAASDGGWTVQTRLIEKYLAMEHDTQTQNASKACGPGPNLRGAG